MPGATIIGHERFIVDIGMRRNALHPKGTSFGARLLAPYDNRRYTLRGFGSRFEGVFLQRQRLSSAAAEGSPLERMARPLFICFASALTA
jgi:hypothetical protein